MTEQLNLKTATGILICYKIWDDLDKYAELLTKLSLPDTLMFKAFNQIDGIEYPFTLALIVKDKHALDTLDNSLSGVDEGSDIEIYSGNARIQEFLGMMHIGKYPPGFLKIRYGRCERKAVKEMACMFCSCGHMLECHYNMSCTEAMCSHLRQG
jgi:hypothetical protein